MDSIDSTQKGGANAAPKTESMSESYSNDVGVGSGSTFPGGSADAKGSDRGHDAVRSASPTNPQNTHEVVCKEYKRVGHVGPTTFPDEP
jgi:hypothetical protein